MAKAPTANSPEMIQEEVEKEIVIHKGLYIALVVLIIGAIVGYTIYYTQAEKNLNLRLDAIQAWAKGFDGLEDKKTTVDEIYSSYKMLDKELLNDVSIYPYTLELSQKLQAESKVDKAIEVIELGLNSGDKDFTWYLLSTHLASLYEEKGDFANSIKIYETLLKTPYKFNEAKVNFEIGRIYKEMGNAEKAKEYLGTTIAQFPNEEITKLAKILLREIK